MKFFSKCEQICGKLPICSHLLKKTSTEKFIFSAVLHAVISNLFDQEGKSITACPLSKK